MLDEYFNGNEKERVDKRSTGFVLLTFPFTEEYADIKVNYISNGVDREVMTALLKGVIERFERTQGDENDAPE